MIEYGGHEYEDVDIIIDGCHNFTCGRPGTQYGLYIESIGDSETAPRPLVTNFWIHHGAFPIIPPGRGWLRRQYQVVCWYLWRQGRDPWAVKRKLRQKSAGLFVKVIKASDHV